MFLWSFANRFKTMDEMNAVASVVWSEGGAYMAVRLAKAAGAKNVDIDSWGYPIRALPDWKQIGKPVEEAAGLRAGPPGKRVQLHRPAARSAPRA